MIKHTSFRKVTMHGVGISHANAQGGPTLRTDPWWHGINGVWWTTSKRVHFVTFRRNQLLGRGKQS